MTPNHLQRLSKVLALADSSQDGEAVAAVRMAKQLLTQNGLSFADLAQSAANSPNIVRSAFSTGAFAHKITDTQIAELQLKIRQMQSAGKLQSNELAHARVNMARLEASLVQAQQEVEKWRQLAQETANKLWDIGQQIENDRAVTRGVVNKLQEIVPSERKPANGRVPAPANYSRERRFVRNSLLDAQEVEAFAAAHLVK
jgi:chromosome segregation ATPase